MGMYPIIYTGGATQLSFFDFRNAVSAPNPFGTDLPIITKSILSGLFWLRSCVVSVLNAVRSVTTLRGLLLARFFCARHDLCACTRRVKLSLPFHYRLLMTGFPLEYLFVFAPVDIWGVSLCIQHAMYVHVYAWRKGSDT